MKLRIPGFVKWYMLQPLKRAWLISWIVWTALLIANFFNSSFFWPSFIGGMISMPLLAADTIVSSRRRQRVSAARKQLDHWKEEFTEQAAALAYKVINGELSITATSESEEEARAMSEETQKHLMRLREAAVRLRRELKEFENNPTVKREIDLYGKSK